MSSVHWPAPSVWVIIAQLVEHCSANAEAMGLNPDEAPKNYFGGYFAIAQLRFNCDGHTFILFDVFYGAETLYIEQTNKVI